MAVREACQIRLVSLNLASLTCTASGWCPRLRTVRLLPRFWKSAKEVGAGVMMAGPACQSGREDELLRRCGDVVARGTVTLLAGWTLGRTEMALALVVNVED